MYQQQQQWQPPNSGDTLQRWMWYWQSLARYAWFGGFSLPTLSTLWLPNQTTTHLLLLVPLPLQLLPLCLSATGRSLHEARPLQQPVCSRQAALQQQRHLPAALAAVGAAAASAPAGQRVLYPQLAAHASGFLKVSELHTLYYEVYGSPRGVPAVVVHGGPGAGCFPNHARFFDPAHYRCGGRGWALVCCCSMPAWQQVQLGNMCAQQPVKVSEGVAECARAPCGCQQQQHMPCCLTRLCRALPCCACRIILVDQRGCGRSTPYGCLAGNTTADLVQDLEQLRRALGVQQWVMLGGSWGVALTLAYAQVGGVLGAMCGVVCWHAAANGSSSRRGLQAGGRLDRLCAWQPASAASQCCC